MSEREPLLAGTAAEPAERGTSATRNSSGFSVRQAVVAETIGDALDAYDPNASAFVFTSARNALDDEDDEGDEENGIVTADGTQLRPDLWVILGGLWVGSFLAALDSTVVASALTVIGSEFNASNAVSWLGTSYLMSMTAFQPLYGKAADIFGRKTMTLFASVTFLLGSLFCAISQTYTQLILSRAFAGIGGGGLTTMGSIVTSDLVPLRRRGVYQGYANVIYGLGAALGGPLGGLIGDTIGWRWIFFIQVPFCTLHAMLVFWKVDIPLAKGDMLARLKRIDYLGSLVLIAAVASMLTGLSMGGNQKPWGDPSVWGAILAGGILFVVFGLVESFVAAEPLCPPRIVFARTPAAINMTLFFAHLVQYAIIYQAPLYFSIVQAKSNAAAGSYLIANVFWSSTASVVTGAWMSKTGTYKSAIVFSASCTALGLALMTTWRQGGQAEFIYWLALAISGFGFGGILTTTVVALISAVAPEDMAPATGTSYLYRSIGSVLAISLSNMLLQNILKSKLTTLITGPDAAYIIERARSDVQYVLSLAPELKETIIGAYQGSMHDVFVYMFVASFFTVAATLPIQHFSLGDKLEAAKQHMGPE